MSDDYTRSLRRQIAQLQATQTYLRVAASKALPFPNVWRAEGRAEQRCHELLASMGMEFGRLKRGMSTGSTGAPAIPRRATPPPASRQSGAPSSRREAPPSSSSRSATRRSGLVSFDDTQNDSPQTFISYDQDDDDRTLIGAQPVRPPQGSPAGRGTPARGQARSNGGAPARGGRPVTGRSRTAGPPSRRATPSQPLARASSGPQSRWGRGPEGRSGRIDAGRDALVTVDEDAPNVADDLGAFDEDEEKLFGDEGATVVGDPRDALPPHKQTPTPAPPDPPSPARVTSGLYGGSSVPSVRPSSTRPRAAAVQLNTGGTGGRVVGLDDDIEPIEIGSAEDDDEFVEHTGTGFSVSLQLHEDESDAEPAFVDEEEDLELMNELSETPGPQDDVSRVSPAEVAQLFADARSAASGGDLNAAADLFSDVIDADPDHVEAHVARGRVFLDLGDYSRAMSDFMVAEEIAQDNPEPQVAIGDLYFARKDYRRAIEYFNAALELDPEHAMAFCRRGISHYYRKNYNDALEDLLHAQQLRPDIPNLTTYVAMAQKKKQRKKRP